ncbi:FxsA family protein [Aureibacillus halotolerans]|uniref:UPF0716 protein FxsA n=1 Tax=Aureibacillus halotolerans TaxID=1508390 RepID=A0A4R6U3R1_9BACI|nr:FxsA family protein [Aureibacillus halotolerans]TDQ39139.1 UPF0716 protein FxsA [Aureibacillus halotolerans]
MQKWLLLLLIVVPALEVGMFIFAGQTFGYLPTVLLIILSGIIGAWLLKREGTKLLFEARRKIDRGIPPTEEMIDGVCVIVGGIMLVFPGFISDIIGLFFLIPGLRSGPRRIVQLIITFIASKKGFIIFRR